MTGLAGLLFTSATGAKAQWIPRARPSRAVTSPLKRAASSERVAPMAIAKGSGTTPAPYAEGHPPLHVGGHEQRQSRRSCSSLRSAGQGPDLGLEDDHRPDLRALGPGRAAPRLGAMPGGVEPGDPHADQLARPSPRGSGGRGSARAQDERGARWARPGARRSADARTARQPAERGRSGATRAVTACRGRGPRDGDAAQARRARRTPPGGAGSSRGPARDSWENSDDACGPGLARELDLLHDAGEAEPVGPDPRPQGLPATRRGVAGLLHLGAEDPAVRGVGHRTDRIEEAVGQPARPALELVVTAVQPRPAPPPPRRTSARPRRRAPPRPAARPGRIRTSRRYSSHAAGACAGPPRRSRRASHAPEALERRTRVVEARGRDSG